MTPDISNMEDILDSRDIIAALEEMGNDMPEGDHARNWEGWDDYNALSDLAKQGEAASPDWQYGATLVRDSYFVEYVQDMLIDCGELPKDLPHYVHIDWEATARDVRVDYTPVEYDGITYWVR